MLQVSTTWWHWSSTLLEVSSSPLKAAEMFLYHLWTKLTAWVICEMQELFLETPSWKRKKFCSSIFERHQTVRSFRIGSEQFWMVSVHELSSKLGRTYGVQLWSHRTLRRRQNFPPRRPTVIPQVFHSLSPMLSKSLTLAVIVIVIASQLSLFDRAKNGFLTLCSNSEDAVCCGDVANLLLISSLSQAFASELRGSVTFAQPIYSDRRLWITAILWVVGSEENVGVVCCHSPLNLTDDHVMSAFEPFTLREV